MIDGFPFVHRETVRFRDVDGSSTSSGPADAWSPKRKSVLVGYDYGSGVSRAIPDRWRRRLTE